MNTSQVTQREALLLSLQEKEALIADFLYLTQIQTEILRQEDVSMEAFADNLSRRKVLIEQIDALQKKQDELLRAYLAQATQAEQEEIAQLRARIRTQLEEISRLDQENQAQAKAQLEHYGSQIKKSKLSQQTLGAYYRNAAIDGESFFDKTR